MREVVDADRLVRFMRALGDEATVDGRIYLTGGATAVLLGWRSSTIDVDIKLVPEHASVTQAIPQLKEALHINVELAAPDQFIPPLPGWEERSRFIERHGRASFLHYDFYAQALAKIERGHVQDLEDVRQMIGLGLVDRRKALDLFGAIEPELHRYPAIDPASFRKEAERALGQKS
jgi:hypothetical protein